MTLLGSAVTVTGTSLVCPCWRTLQGSLATLISPLEHLVRIYSMLTSHARDRSARDKRRFYNPTLLPCCSSQPSPGGGPLTQLQRYRSQGHRGTDQDICLYGENRTLTSLSPRSDTCWEPLQAAETAKPLEGVAVLVELARDQWATSKSRMRGRGMFSCRSNAST